MAGFLFSGQTEWGKKRGYYWPLPGSHLQRSPFDGGGFTLVELMLVVALLGVITAVSLPCFQTVRARYELAAVARQMAEDIRECQQIARGWRAEGGLAETSSFQIRFDSTGDSYSLNLDNSPLKTIAMPAGVDLVKTNFPEARLVMRVNGGPSGRGGTVSLRSRRTGDYLFVVVAAVSGRVRVSPTEPGDEEILGVK